MKRSVLLLVVFVFLASTALYAEGERESEVRNVRAEVTPPGEYPIVKEKAILSVYFIPGGPEIGEIDTLWATKYFEELTNVHVDWTESPSGENLQKVNLLFASGEKLPDIIMPSCGLRDAVSMYGPEGLIMPLNDLIDEYGYYLPKNGDAFDPSWRKAITAPDGNLYAFPWFNECYKCSFHIRGYINKTWLDNYNLEMPTTTDEFYELMKYFKTHDMNKNGKMDEIPIISNNQRWPWGSRLDEFLMNAFIPSTGQYKFWEYNNNGTVHLAPMEPGWRDGLEYLHKLYAEELIDQDIFIATKQDITSLTEAPEGNRVGVSFGYIGDVMLPERDGGARDDFVALLPLKGPNGNREIVKIPPSDYNDLVAIITKDCEDPALAMRWIDSMYDLKNVVLWRGEPGVDWKEAEPGQKGVDGRDATWIDLKGAGELGHGNWGLALPSFSTRETFYFSQPVEPGVWNQEEYDYIQAKAIEPFANTEAAFPVLSFTDEEAEVVNEARGFLYDYIAEHTAKFVTGQLDVDEGWDKYVAGFKAFNVDEYLSILQTAYDRQVK